MSDLRRQIQLSLFKQLKLPAGYQVLPVLPSGYVDDSTFYCPHLRVLDRYDRAMCLVVCTDKNLIVAPGDRIIVSQERLQQQRNGICDTVAPYDYSDMAKSHCYAIQYADPQLLERLGLAVNLVLLWASSVEPIWPSQDQVEKPPGKLKPRLLAWLLGRI